MYHASRHLTTCDVIACNELYQAIPHLMEKIKPIAHFVCVWSFSHCTCRSLSPVDWAHLSPRSMQLCLDALQHVGQDSFLYIGIQGLQECNNATLITSFIFRHTTENLGKSLGTKLTDLYIRWSNLRTHGLWFVGRHYNLIGTFTHHTCLLHIASTSFTWHI